MAGEVSRIFPQYLSAPIQVLWFETDELVIFMGFFLLAMIYGRVFWLLLPVMPYLYSRVKRQKPRGFFCHLLYMAGLIKMKNYPDYFQQEFHE